MNPVGLAVLAVGLVLFGVSWTFYRRRRLVLDMPTSKTASMAVGPVELKGTAEADAKTLEAPLSGAPCLHYAYSVEEQRTRTVTTKGAGGRRTTRRETYWATILSGEERVPFRLRDATGAALVDPAGAALPAPETNEWSSGLGRDPPPRIRTFLVAKGRDFEGLFGANKTMRYRERRLPAGTALYLLGTALRREGATGDGNAALVVQKKGRVPFLVSDKDEKGVVAGYSWKFGLALAAGIALAGAGVYLLGR